MSMSKIVAMPILAGLWGPVLATVQVEECAPEVEGVGDEASMLQFLAKGPHDVQDDWTLHEGYNCYPGHGAAEQTESSRVDGYLSCKAKHPTMSGVVLDHTQTHCWGIGGVTLEECITGSPYSTYLRPASNQDSFCGKPCTWATELTDCGGECGICDGHMCSASTPPPLPTEAPSFCGKPCTWATEHIDCGGECGLCDGQLCISGTPPQQLPTDGPTSSWTLHEGRNCYPQHGAEVSDRQGGVSGYPECESKCYGYDGLVLDQHQTTCWCINGIDMASCVGPDSGYSTYVK